MTHFFKQIAVISISLVLFCVGAIAQNEKSTKSTRNGSYGVSVSVPSVEIKPKGFAYIKIVVEEGYHNPFLIDEYGNSNSIVYGEVFTARITTVNGNRCVYIETSGNIKEKKTETIYVKAMIKYDDYGSSRSTTQNRGVPLVITVDPNLK
jgi:hypothetical protein